MAIPPAEVFTVLICEGAGLAEVLVTGLGDPKEPRIGGFVGFTGGLPMVPFNEEPPGGFWPCPPELEPLIWLRVTTVRFRSTDTLVVPAGPRVVTFTGPEPAAGMLTAVFEVFTVSVLLSSLILIQTEPLAAKVKLVWQTLSRQPPARLSK